MAVGSWRKKTKRAGIKSDPVKKCVKRYALSFKLESLFNFFHIIQFLPGK